MKAAQLAQPAQPAQPAQLARSAQGARADWTALDLLSAVGGIAAVWLVVLHLHLVTGLFGLLITYCGAHGIAGLLQRRWPRMRHAVGLGLTLIIVLLLALLGLGIERAADAAVEEGGFAALMQQMAAGLEKARSALPAWAGAHVPGSVEALRDGAVHGLREHAGALRLWGGNTARAIGHLLAGIVIGALLALELPRRRDGGAGTDGAPLLQWLDGGFARLTRCFSSVVFAQVRIAAINAALTALFLMVLLPLTGTHLPLARTLVVITFLAGLLPVVGNLVSNVVIAAVALTESIPVALMALGWLVAIHKLEYFLNAQIIGHRIHARAWELLTAMLVMEAAFGLPGLVCAPIVYAQVKEALAQRGFIR